MWDKDHLRFFCFRTRFMRKLLSSDISMDSPTQDPIAHYVAGKHCLAVDSFWIENMYAGSMTAWLVDFRSSLLRRHFLLPQQSGLLRWLPSMRILIACALLLRKTPPEIICHCNSDESLFCPLTCSCHTSPPRSICHSWPWLHHLSPLVDHLSGCFDSSIVNDAIRSSDSRIVVLLSKSYY